MVQPEQYTGTTTLVHLHNHTVYSTLDGVASPQQYAEECKKRGYPAMSATEHGNMASVPDMWTEFKKAGVKYIAGCFLSDQPILLGHGVEQIQHVVPGMMAVTDQNRLRPVKNLQIRDYDDDIVTIKAWGVEDIRATPEHPFLVREIIRQTVSSNRYNQNITVGMRKAGELFRHKYTSAPARKGGRRSGDQKQNYRFYLCVPRMKPGNLTHLNLADYIFPDSQEARSAVVNRVIESVSYRSEGYATTKKVGLPERIELDDELLWIMGLWLAEGSGDNVLVFSLCADEYHYYQRIADYFAKFGITTSPRDRSDRGALEVEVYSSYFVRLFRNLFGSGFADKRIPWFLMEGLNTTQTESLLNGLFDGDSKLGDRQSYLKLNNRSLVWQARMLLTRLGQYSAVTPMVCNNSGNLSWVIRRREAGRYYYDVDHDYIYLPIYDVTKETYTGKVYNFEVEEDHTYNVGVAVHNCEIYYNNNHLEFVSRRDGGLSPQACTASDDPQIWSDYFRLFRSRHMTILAKNEAGFNNLLKLTTEVHRVGGQAQRGRSRAWFDLLCKHKEGLIVLSGCLNGPVSYALKQRKAVKVEVEEGGKIKYKLKEVGPILPKKERFQLAAREMKRFHKVFGDDFIVELQMPVVPDKTPLEYIDRYGYTPYEEELVDLQVFRDTVEIADHLGLPYCVANDCHYLDRKSAFLQRLMMAVDQELTVDSPDLFASNSDHQYMKTRAELWATYHNYGYARGLGDGVFERMCDNTLMVADRCKPLKIDQTPKVPKWKTDPDLALRDATHKALKDRGLWGRKERYLIDGRMVTYREQAEIELERFISKGFSSYFLITADLVAYGKRQGWPFSPRGSAGGSLVCMLLGIHTLDPMKWGLSFDRFMSPSRGGYMLNLGMPEPLN